MSRSQPSRKIIQTRITVNGGATLLNKLLVRIISGQIRDSRSLRCDVGTERCPREKFAAGSQWKPLIPSPNIVKVQQLRTDGDGVQHHGAVDSSEGAAISPLGCLSGLCVRHRDRSHQPQPHLLAQSRPDLHTITGGGMDRGEGGTDQSQISRSRRNMKRLNPVRQAELPLTRGMN